MGFIRNSLTRVGRILREEVEVANYFYNFFSLEFSVYCLNKIYVKLGLVVEGNNKEV